MTEGRGRRIIFYVVASGVALFFLVSPIVSVFVKGIFHWHVSQPAFWRDVVELSAYLIAMLAASWLARGAKGAAVLLIGGFYLLSMGTLLQCVASYLYLEGILLIGRFFLEVLFRRKEDSSAGVCFLAGSVCFGVPAIVLSLLGVGTIADLRVLTAVLLLAAVLFHRIRMEEFLVVKYLNCLNRCGRKEFLAHLFFVAILLISCARVNTYIEYDSNWYALYPDKCLFGERSFYDYLGYTDFVYYYPKFKELLLAPISGLGLPGYLISINLWIALLCAVEVYQYLTEQVKGNRLQVFCVLYLMFSTASVIGISATAKSDAVGYLYLLMLILYFARYLQGGRQSFLWIALAAGVMSYTVKYTNFVFSTLILILVSGMLLWQMTGRRLRWEKHSFHSFSGMILVLLAAFVLCGILYRTYRLTGYPTYREAVGLWEWLGFQAKPYFGAPIRDQPGKVFEIRRIWSLLFGVNDVKKITVLWTGNYTVFFLLCLGLYRDRRRNRNPFLLASAVVLAASSLYFLITMAGPDGNYFSAAVIVSTCYLLIRMTESGNWESRKAWFTAVVSMFLLLNLAFVFVTHPSWNAGTRFSESPIPVLLSEEEKYERKEDGIRALGLYEINEKLKETDGKRFLLVDGDDVKAYVLNARVELAWGLLQRYLSGAGIECYEDFARYVGYAGVDGFLVERDGGAVEEFLRFRDYVSQYIEENGYLERMDTEKYIYYRIR